MGCVLLSVAIRKVKVWSWALSLELLVKDPSPVDGSDVHRALQHCKWCVAHHTSSLTLTAPLNVPKERWGKLFKWTVVTLQID